MLYLYKKNINWKLRLSTLAFFVFVLVGKVSFASIIIPLTWQELIAQSDLIVKGRVENTEATSSSLPQLQNTLLKLFPFMQIFEENVFIPTNPLKNKKVSTKIKITPLEVLKGEKTFGTSIIVEQPGGKVGDIILAFDNSPKLTYNHTSILFLQKKSNGNYQVTNFNQGKIDISGPLQNETATLYKTILDKQTLSYQEVKQQITCSQTPSCNNINEKATLAFDIADEEYTLMDPPYRYRQEYMPIPYTIDTAKDPTGNQGVSLIQQSFAHWQESGNISFRYQGTTTYSSTVDAYTGDHTIRISLFDTYNGIDTNNIVALGGSYYTTSKNSAGEGFYEAMNGFVIFNDSTMARNYLASSGHFEQIATHEIGHVLGLGHSKDTTAIMYGHGSNEIPTAIQLQDSDKKGIQALYPFNKQEKTIPNTSKTVQPTPTVLTNNTAAYQSTFPTDTYEAQWISQTLGSNEEKNHIVISKGNIREVTAQFQNTGSSPWLNNGKNMVAFYIYKDPNSTPPIFNNPQSPLFGRSLFETESWGPSFNGQQEKTRTAILKEDHVNPGGTGTFIIQIHAPQNTTAGRYREDFSLAYGENWMPNLKNGDSIHRAHIWFPIQIVD
ncbi:MAG: matrixin family metalloprotease [bacterium]